MDAATLTAQQPDAPSPSDPNDVPNYDDTAPSESADDVQANQESKITNLKYLNILSFLLTAIMVIGVVLLRVREEGVFADAYRWMKYQTLITPAKYVNWIWFLIFVLHGLFIYASTVHKTLRMSPLIGFNAAVSTPRQSVAVHYPAICASTLMMVYSHDYGFIGCAFLSSVLCGVILARVLKIQTTVMNEMELTRDENNTIRTEKDEENPSSGTFPTPDTDDILQYVALRLPFELYGGYALALVVLYFNTFLDSFDVPTKLHLAMANFSIIGLTAAGAWLLWKIPGRKLDGAGAALVWYMLGVVIELCDPTQRIYNMFSDRAILTTKIMAALATTALMTLLGVRVMNTMTKKNLWGLGALLGGKSVANEEDDEEISTDYVHA